MNLRRAIPLVALLAATAALAGCVSTKVVYEQKGTEVKLVSRRGRPLGLEQPITIAPVRLSHILAAIDIRLSVKEGQQRRPAFHIDTLDAIAEGLAVGLREANSNQRVVVYSTRREKHFKIFDKEFLTSFIAYVHGEHLFVHLSRTDWEIPPRRKDRLPEPEIGDFPMKFRILPSRGMRLVDEQALAVEWRADTFSRPTRTRVTPGGKMVRKTILMESEEPEPESDPEVESEPVVPERTPAVEVPTGIPAETLRALADLEERRQRGEIREYEYEIERQKILEAAAAEPNPAREAGPEVAPDSN